jgi:two-component system sensor histidine kinase YesM
MIKLLQRFVNKAFNLRIVTKAFVGYIVVICIPMIIVIYIINQQIYHSMLEQFSFSKQQFFEEAQSNLNVDLVQTESIYRLLQNNSALIAYLNGNYALAADLVYNYLANIKPTLELSMVAAPYIDGIRIYKYKSEVMTLPSTFFQDSNELEGRRESSQIRSLRINKGFWIYDIMGTKNSDFPSLRYMQKLFDDEYSKELAVLEIKLDSGALRHFAELTSDSLQHNIVNVMFTDEEGHVLSRHMDELLNPELLIKIEDHIRSKPVPYFFANDNRLLVNTVDLEKLKMKAIFISNTSGFFSGLRNKQLTLAYISIASLLVLSLFYYSLASSIARRVIRLSRHMKKVNENNLTPYLEIGSKDEIGFLVYSYNTMILRIHELIHTVHQTEVLKKEAEFKMLQAQIKPHFLYNTLESMRMLARVNQDKEVEEMAFSLGSLFRYSLTSDSDETVLTDEIANVEHYISIQKIRMGKRLDFILSAKGEFRTFRCPRFILQPLVENCIQHALVDHAGVWFILMSVEETDEAVEISIKDNGSGMTEERLLFVRELLMPQADQRMKRQSDQNGIGLFNVNERVKLYYGQDSGLTVESKAGEGTTFFVRLCKE